MSESKSGTETGVQSTVHTPGPWVMTQNAKTGCKIWGADRKPVAIILGGVERSHISPEQPIPEWRHNGRLIQAAPDLLEALELLWLEVAASGNGTANDFGWKNAREKTLAALRKATY